MKIAFLGLFLVLALGCIVEPKYPSAVPIVTSANSNENNGYSIVAMPTDNSSTAVAGTDLEPARDRTWISPGKVNIGNYYPGAIAEWNISIHNGKPRPVQFSVKYRDPLYTADGYAKPIAGAQYWVAIVDSAPLLSPFETRKVLVRLQMPLGTNSFAPKWEYWISVFDETQAGTVNTEICTRFLIVMR